jgi:two-component system alkaline phosphatase synthesis response regulator PhoP
MKSILVVDDERDIVDLLKYNLQKEGYTVTTARTGAQALQQAAQRPQLILLDIMIPDLDGWEVVKRLKSSPATAQIPVMFLTAKGTEIDEVLGLELGAVDYIVKPISIPKLLARVKNIFRKQEAPAGKRPYLRPGKLEILPGEHRIRVGGKEVFFPKKEFEILLYLADHIEQVVTREVLLQAVWSPDVLVVDRTVDVHIRKIREKLGKWAEHIETIKGVGYRMRDLE